MTEGDLPASARVGRAALVVSDVDDLTEFYRDVVGLAVLDRERDRATLGAGDTPLLELRAGDVGERPPNAAGLFHVAFRLPDRDALADAFRRIRANWRLSGASDHRVSEALYLRDPEGNGVELYRDRERSAWPTTDDGRVEMDTRSLDLDALAADALAGSGDGEVGGRAPAGTDIGHVHLEVTDLAAARAFYVDALGLRVRQDWGDGALFTAAGDYHHHVGLNAWNARSEPLAGRGLDWFELLVPDADAVDAATARLRGAGFDVERVDDGVAATDADGIEVRLRTE
ncbi:VOC family protein [Halocalculus aciditolerans]|uniref:Glyoxalase n=1 Tax=Halocalculus aciditolerans TaxID=1383812 RepID=A0A830F008_9EURY|nr:VOC family protein [Halocalculus aciditolerans]GGL47464.1 glyoxalase [Halocalculus aciditolerans]